MKTVYGLIVAGKEYQIQQDLLLPTRVNSKTEVDYKMEADAADVGQLKTSIKVVVKRDSVYVQVR